MTTPTPLAETIARLQTHIRATGEGTGCLTQEQCEALLSCARRCEVIDRKLKLESPGHAPCDSCPEWGVCPTCGHTGYTEAAYLIELEERTAERDALAKRVGELERVPEPWRLERGRIDSLVDDRDNWKIKAHDAEAESTRLRAENERLAATLEQTRDDGEGTWREWRDRYNQRLTDLTAAQDRVRELEDRLGAVRVARELWETSCGAGSHRAFADAVTIALDTPGPITDPTPSFRWVKDDGADGGHVYVVLDGEGAQYGPGYVDITGWLSRCCSDPAAVIAKAEEFRLTHRNGRPSCIPADCQHFEQLPSGLWAWVEGQTIRVEGRGLLWNMYKRDHTYSWLAESIRETLTEPDFLAARALGVRVLGWAK